MNQIDIFRAKRPMRLVRITEDDQINEDDMSRVRTNLNTIDLAVISAFITSDIEERPKTKHALTWQENMKRNKRLDKDLQGYGYGFRPVKGWYDETGNFDDADGPDEMSFLVTKPDDVEFTKFLDNIIGLARDYEQVAVIIWDHDERRGYMYATDNFTTYTLDDEFRAYSFNDLKQQARTALKNNFFTFTRGKADK